MQGQFSPTGDMIFIVAGLVLVASAFVVVGIVSGSLATDTRATQSQKALDGLVEVIDRGCQQNLGNRDPTVDLPNIRTIEVTNERTLKGTLTGDGIVTSTASGCGQITIDGGTLAGGEGVEILIEYDHSGDESNVDLSRVNE